MRTGPATLDLKVIAGSVTLLLSLAALTVAVVPPSAPGASGSSFDASPDGTKAAFELLSAAGWQTTRSIEPLTALRANPARTVLILADPGSRPSAQDRLALARFMGAGGIVLAAGTSSIAFLPGMTPPENALSTRSAPLDFVPAAPTALARGLRSVRMPLPVRAVHANPATWVTAFASDGDAGVMISRGGAADSVWLASAYPLSNAGIAEGGHLQLLLNVLGPPGQRAIVWDEHYHGFARTFWSYVAGTPVAWGLAQAGLIALLILFTAARRLGPIRPRYVIPRTSPLEFVETMGGLYGRARAAGAAVATARSHARRRLAAAAGVSAVTTDEALVGALQRRFGLDAMQTRSTLEESTGSVTEGEALGRVASLQRLVHQVTVPQRTAGRPVDAGASR